MIAPARTEPRNRMKPAAKKRTSRTRKTAEERIEWLTFIAARQHSEISRIKEKNADLRRRLRKVEADMERFFRKELTR